MRKPAPRTTNRDSDEFKATVVRRSQLPGLHVQNVAASLYIHPFRLSRCRKLVREGVITTKDVAVDQAVTAELKELRRVMKAYERSKGEHGLLKRRSRLLPPERRTLRLDGAAARKLLGETLVSFVRCQCQRVLRLERSPTQRMCAGRCSFGRVCAAGASN